MLQFVPSIDMMARAWQACRRLTLLIHHGIGQTAPPLAAIVKGYNLDLT